MKKLYFSISVLVFVILACSLGPFTPGATPEEAQGPGEVIGEAFPATQSFVTVAGEVVEVDSPVPDALTEELFQAPVPSESGLGVGLYQAAAFAKQSGYRLKLAENREGRVCFELIRRQR